MYKAAICAIVKNEHDYLLEWVAYHRAIGVDHILIYNNGAEGDDGTTLLLNKLEAAGAVETVAWPDRPEWRLPSDVYLRPQIPAYYDGLSRLSKRAEWVAFIDVDEFIVPMRDEDLPSALNFYGRYGAIGVNWKMFGSSGERFKRPDLVIKRFTSSSTQLCGANFHVKSIVRPELVRDISVHRPFLESGKLVDEHGREITDSRGLHDSVSYDILRINHYYTKSREEWMIKAARGRADHPRKKLEESFRETDFNDEPDTFILKFYSRMLREMRSLARHAGIVDYPGLTAVEPRRTSRNARRIYSRYGRLPSRPRTGPALGGRSGQAGGTSPLPVVEVRQRGSLGARMVQYLVARRIAAEAGECALSNVLLPEWGIAHPRLPGAPGDPLEDPKAGQRVDIPCAARALSLGLKASVCLTSGGQWMSNLPELEFCRSIFPAEESEYPGHGPESLVCLVEFPEPQDWHGVMLPVEFYADLAQRDALELVFLGKREDNPYWQALRRRFPDAQFPPSQGAKRDFQLFRNSRHLVPGIGIASWLAAWLSQADRIEFAVNGLFHPRQEPNVDLLPLFDSRYRFHLFPINYATPANAFHQAHEALSGAWREIDPEELGRLRPGRAVKKLEGYVALFDEEFYLKNYPDIAAAVRSGGLPKGLIHYMGSGFAEGRGGFRFDDRWYSVAYPDAARAVSEGEYADLSHHYVEAGAARGYSPAPLE